MKCHHCLFKILRKNQNVVEKELQRAITLTKLAPGPYFSITNVQLVDINVFAKFDEIPSLLVEVIKKKPKCLRLRITKAITLKELAPIPYFSIINVHLVNNNVFAKFYEILSLLFRDIEQVAQRATIAHLSDPICPKTLCSLSPIPMLLHTKFDQD